jgi:hypothetical protein
MSASQGEKIIRFQDLYKTYSRLSLPNPFDRPIAISGLENRLLKAFDARGGFGVFDGQSGLLQRSLLWYRPADKVLTRIQYPSSSTAMVPPLWSWIAYIGGIDYLVPKFGNIVWMKLTSPWSLARGGDISAKNASTTLGGEVQAIKLDITDENGRLYFDSFEAVDTSAVQCVVLGVEQGNQPPSFKIHYFILVAPTITFGSDGSKVYERIGVGYLLSRYISAAGEMNIH